MIQWPTVQHPVNILQEMQSGMVHMGRVHAHYIVHSIMHMYPHSS